MQIPGAEILSFNIQDDNKRKRDSSDSEWEDVSEDSEDETPTKKEENPEEDGPTVTKKEAIQEVITLLQQAFLLEILSFQLAPLKWNFPRGKYLVLSNLPHISFY